MVDAPVPWLIAIEGGPALPAHSTYSKLLLHTAKKLMVQHVHNKQSCCAAALLVVGFHAVAQAAWHMAGSSWEGSLALLLSVGMSLCLHCCPQPPDIRTSRHGRWW
eukprot:GHRQ01029334.1.p2 GENE.GHRQ01029334.1~~GHRQ01029334.1.p2  ORF type:complete len:106 (+),score=17.38 GHRQ01029334.1:405-722(+)